MNMPRWGGEGHELRWGLTFALTSVAWWKWCHVTSRAEPLKHWAWSLSILGSSPKHPGAMVKGAQTSPRRKNTGRGPHGEEPKSLNQQPVSTHSQPPDVWVNGPSDNSRPRTLWSRDMPSLWRPFQTPAPLNSWDNKWLIYTTKSWGHLLVAIVTTVSHKSHL